MRNTEDGTHLTGCHHHSVATRRRRAFARVVAIFAATAAATLALPTAAHAARPAPLSHDFAYIKASHTGAFADSYQVFNNAYQVDYDVYVEDTACDNKSAIAHLEYKFADGSTDVEAFTNGNGCGTYRHWSDQQYDNPTQRIFSVRIRACTMNAWPGSATCGSWSAWAYNPHY